MRTRDNVLRHLKQKKSVSGESLTKLLGITRQAVNKHLKKLITEGLVQKQGTTKGALYRLSRPSANVKLEQKYHKKYRLKGLEEHLAFKEMSLFLNLKKHFNKDALEILNYTFTETLNNAIDHSRSRYGEIEVVFGPYQCRIKIRDYGIGVFFSIFNKFHLRDEITAVGELIKGKTTTMKTKHSGEGIFFSSKSVDYAAFRSHRLNLVFDNLRNDVFVEEPRFLKGTEVTLRLNKNSRRKLSEVFRRYAPEDYDYRFERTKVSVKLFQQEYISRSEARRLLSGLDKFKEIIMNFKGVKSAGQGFMDEIFRVFRKEHPEIILAAENLSPALQMMLKHVVDNKI
ncbi:MAG: DUF4325 domain-containing protein [Planctomycetota bacterium]